MKYIPTKLECAKLSQRMSVGLKTLVSIHAAEKYGDNMLVDFDERRQVLQQVSGSLFLASLRFYVLYRIDHDTVGWVGVCSLRRVCVCVFVCVCVRMCVCECVYVS